MALKIREKKGGGGGGLANSSVKFRFQELSKLKLSAKASEQINQY